MAIERSQVTGVIWALNVNKVFPRLPSLKKALEIGGATPKEIKAICEDLASYPEWEKHKDKEEKESKLAAKEENG